MSNNWHKEWKPRKGKEGRRMRWFNLPNNRVRLDYKDDDGTKASQTFNSAKEATGAWEDFKRGVTTAKELRAAGFV